MPPDATRLVSSPTPHGCLNVVVHGARNVKSSSALRILRLLCVVECAGARFKTRSKRTRGAPDWHAAGRLTFSSARDALEDDVVRVSVWDKRHGGHKCMGSAETPLRDVALDSGREQCVMLTGGKFDGAYVTLTMWRSAGEAKNDGEAAVEEPGDARASDEETTAIETTATKDADEASEDAAREVVETFVSFTADEDDDEEQVVVESESTRAEEVAEDEDEDEWSAALRPSKRATEEEATEMEPTTADESDAHVHDEAMRANAVARASEIADIWAEDSMDDIVVVSPPPQPRDRPLDERSDARANRDGAADERAKAINELHTVRHVVSPAKPVSALKDADVEVCRLESASPERPMKSAIKTPPMVSPRQPKQIENEDDLVAALLSPGRMNGARVTFDERLMRTQLPTRTAASPKTPTAPKTVAHKVPIANGAPRTPSSAHRGVFAKKLFAEQVKPFSMPTKAEIDEARQLAMMYERAEAVFASWTF